MRNIKFRGKSIDTGEWIYGSLFIDDRLDTVVTEIVYHEGDGIIHQKYVDSETIGQYTGLQDKNGKEIYEGDIVSAFDEKIKAKIIHGFCGFEFEWITEYTAKIRRRKTEPLFNNTSLIFTVIGNIYKNPELLQND